MVAAPVPRDVAQEVAMGMAAPRYAVHQIDRHACGGGAVIDVVLLPFAAVQQVGPRIAVEDVLAVAGAEDVVAVTAAEPVGHAAADERVVSGAAGQLVAVGVARDVAAGLEPRQARSEEHTSELQSLMRISYAVFCLKKQKKKHTY